VKKKEDNKYAEDFAEPQLDIKGLDSLFNIYRSSNLPATKSDIQELSDMRKELSEATKSIGPDPDEIIYKNIERANRLLDLAEKALDAAGIDNRLLEVSGQLINSITAASGGISGNSYNQEVLAQKARELEFKERQLTIKNAIKGNTGNTIQTQNNIIVSTREDIMKMIADSENEEIIDVETGEVFSS